jgi:hypothetical protein
MAAFVVPSIEDPRAQLRSFVQYFVDVMEEIIFAQSTSADALPSDLISQSLIPQDLIPMFRDAWPICREREVRPFFAAIDSVPIERLQGHGLAGPELRAKLWSVATVSKNLFSDPVKKILSKLLGIIDVVLESLDAATGGIAGGLVELKKAIERLLD